MSLKSLFNKFSGTENKPEKTANQNASAAESLTQLNATKLKAVATEVGAAFPIFETAGFNVEQIDVEVGAVPKLIPHFSVVKSLSNEEEQAIIQSLEEQKLIQFILISLFKAQKMHHLFDTTTMQLTAIEIELAGVPSVKAIFKRLPMPDNVFQIKPEE